MTAWLDRREKVLLHDKFIWHCFQANHWWTQPPPRILPLVLPREVQMATCPTVYSVFLEEIDTKYGAANFKGALAR